MYPFLHVEAEFQMPWYETETAETFIQKTLCFFRPRLCKQHLTGLAK